VSGDIFVVTGASAGIGRAIAARARRDGHRVVNLSRRACDVEGVTDVLVDLADGEAVARALARLRELVRPGERVHLIHNAARSLADSITNFDARACEQMMRINVVSPAELTAGLVPLMGAGSSVIFIGSTLSEKAVPGVLSYVTSKHALVGLVRATVQDLFGRQIHAVCVCPGFVDTELLAPLRARGPEAMTSILSMVSYGRLLSPDEIAAVVVFATANPSLNGAIVHANLGQLER
jgi:NAD(P)-dependent dehydrogenase (short-subunit alcohol dehydrogenase family)